ncbi:hypothetical protein RHMOL_Rhmol07G0184700 [Rhododendron molle]|uniref:Uncharacterized protein n=2 Tax=Rhododendron molle TaxID=49168 RepID=A0ACC0N2B5_RHOML|nr:hypothetical protein RHMOL_Rhmol07G0184700 [Rhododendron molle]KAI8547306.1 hypothetical protein RHMOL_Rhmol07G0184700 [Rhododendron molle]
MIISFILADYGLVHFNFLGQAFVILKTRGAAERIITKLDDRCYMEDFPKIALSYLYWSSTAIVSTSMLSVNQILKLADSIYTWWKLHQSPKKGQQLALLTTPPVVRPQLCLPQV